ncbi:LAGLIDADG family homing endonuclease [Streptomyces sp. NPDC096013]|uniref:LAGLIDADG family homing endonuclease n=1 Tax=Streptomyces sp. NPDC096013 TaxID=3366069 RepID=UPI003819D6D0
MADHEPIGDRFMDLRVPEYAYMFGFLQADGHLQQGVGQKGKLSVEINVRDIDLLREFQKLTPYNSSITERTRSTNFAKTHHSGRKSKAIAPPRGEFSHRDYLRGVIDADGSVGYTNKGFPFVSLTTASTAIATYLGRRTQEVTGAERLVKRNTRDAIYNVLYTKETPQKLAVHLYCLGTSR